MDEYSIWGGCKVSTCSLNESTIIFKELQYNVYQCLYKNMPEITLSEKIIKLRHIHHLERTDLAVSLGCHIDTVLKWEVDNVMPKLPNIIKLCNLFKVEPGFFHEYYKVLLSDYDKQILTWKFKNNISYTEMSKLIGISESFLKRIVYRKILMSFSLFEKLKYVKVL